jgi:RHS repeat-associated protein
VLAWALLLIGNFQKAQAQICEDPMRVAAKGQMQASSCPEPPPPLPPHGALFTLQSVPTEMVVGQQYAVSMSMQNKGYEAWSAGAGYRLGSQNPENNGTWGLARVAVPGVVQYNEAATFNFTVTAPTTPGAHNFRWQMLQEGVAWFGSPSPNVAITVHASTIMGSIDGIANGNIEGWACSTRISQPISVHIYAGGAYGTGVGIGIATANVASEPAVGAACLSGGTAHRFRIPISQQWITQHGGKAIYVHGISPVGASNLTINGSGGHHIPQNQAPTVSLTSPAQGEIVREGGQVVLRAQASDPDDGVASVTFYANGQAIGTRTAAPYELTWTSIPPGLHQVHAEVSDTRGAATASGSIQVKSSQVIGDINGVSGGNIWGWACSTFWDPSIALHMYLGGPAGSGVYVSAHMANAPSESAVATACQASGAAYRFSIPVTEELVLQHGGKSIYIHGLSPLGGPNHTIGRSGTFQIPANQAPAVAITSPVSGSVQMPAAYTLQATATDADDSVAKVTFFANGQAIHTSTAAPYRFPVANVPEGTTTYHAVAEDTRGAQTTSAPVVMEMIRVNGSQPLIPSRPGVKRHYVYDTHQQLCKVIEPETGSTVMDYDGAGNLIWSASGLALPSTTSCDRDAAWASGRVVKRFYDERNRLEQLEFPDHKGNQTWTYTATGQPKTITTYNSDPSEGGGTQVINVYDYHRRGLLKGESVSQPGWYAWGIGYAYDRNANLQVQTYPTNLAINYAPNALGQPTQARDQSGYAYASGISYYPNGAVKQFTYGNGIVHSMGQNDRQLPRKVVSSGVLDNEYSYDRAGNITQIRDIARGDHYTRLMTYDDNDRLLTAASCSFGGMDCTHRFTYDARDNMASWVLAGVKDYAEYVYDPVTQRLGNIKNSEGATIGAFEYDLQGNLEHKNNQVYVFDFGNRLRESVGKERYRYDGHGRRVFAREVSSLLDILSQYSQSGQVLYQENKRTGRNDENIYLGGSLVAIREWTASGGYAAKFQHTDALGSPVAVTNQAGTVIERNEYEPYGAVIGKPSYQGIGYTGHVQDAATGLTYMQQRYYDSQVGLFLSVDPVTAFSDPVGQFHRYRYANNNPYKFKDPDGRIVETVWDAANVAMGVSSFVSNAKTGNWGAAAVDAIGVVADSAATVFPVVPGGAGTAIRTVRGAERVAEVAGSAKAAASAGKATDNVVGGGLIPKPPTGPGRVPQSARDPQRLFTPDARAAKRAEQGDSCGTGCGKAIDANNSRGHHIERHADGGRTNSQNHAEVCTDCHKKLHSK